MSPAEWDRLSEFFGAALEHFGDDRKRFLESIGDELRPAIERLLDQHEKAGDFLEQHSFPDVGFEAAEPWTGRILNGRYRIVRFIARGGSGAVYLAHDQHLAGKPVVVKFLHARESSWLRGKFVQEMEVLARIRHRGVVAVLDSGESNEQPFLVMEFINGVTLRAEMKEGRVEIARVARVVRQIGLAVFAAHECGVIHRDLKPENVMLEHPGTSEETVRLIDFGIARVESGDLETITRLTQFAGTTPYMAPEQLNGKPCPASDTFAIAVIAYEMLTGRRPFLSSSPIQLYEQQRAGRLDDPRRERSEVPPGAVRAILRELSFRREDRSASVLEATEAIANALTNPGKEPSSRRKAVVLLAGSAGAATAGTYAWRATTSVPLDARDRVIELPPGTEPLEHGFLSRGDIDYRVVANASVTGFDAIRVVSPDQGGYARRLTPAQARAARHGWRITFEASVQEGSVYCHLDYPTAPHRYVVNLLRTGEGADVVSLPTSVTPVLRGVNWKVPGPAGRRHKFVLSLPRDSDKAELFVDGTKALTGYQGMDDFRYYRGFEVGATSYRVPRAVGVFWIARMEIGQPV